MQTARRFRGAAALGALLAGLAVLFERPVLLVGAAAVGAWLLAGEYRFVRRLVRVADALEVDQSVPRERVSKGEDLPVTLAASLPAPSPLVLEVEAGLPVTATAASREDCTLRIDAGQRGTSTVCTVSWPMAGAFDFDPPSVTATDPTGLFRERFPAGPAPSVTVAARAPGDVHVGAGGERIAAYGEHPAGRVGSGLYPASLREYVPGDAADRIDWKATARLDHPYVREFEAETDRRTALVVDHRATMGVGPEGETKLDYLRQVALAFVDGARDLNDPIGYYAVGDGGVSDLRTPSASHGRYAEVSTLLSELRPTFDGEAAPDGRHAERTRPADASRAAALLADDGSSFGTALLPFFEDARAYVKRIEGDPLFETVEAYLARLRGAVWTVVFTDDARRDELREAIKVARRGDDNVLVFLAPTVLFEPGGLADLEAAYERYVDFEEFRREIARMPRVAAFEVAPGDRVEAVLAAGRRRRGRASAGPGGGG